jgi:hypothetical protein
MGEVEIVPVRKNDRIVSPPRTALASPPTMVRRAGGMPPRPQRRCCERPAPLGRSGSSAGQGAFVRRAGPGSPDCKPARAPRSQRLCTPRRVLAQQALAGPATKIAWGSRSGVQVRVRAAAGPGPSSRCAKDDARRSATQQYFRDLRSLYPARPDLRRHISRPLRCPHPKGGKDEFGRSIRRRTAPRKSLEMVSKASALSAKYPASLTFII